MADKETELNLLEALVSLKVAAQEIAVGLEEIQKAIKGLESLYWKSIETP